MVQLLMSTNGQNFGLAGKMLISTPYMEGGTCFSKSVIYILTHDDNGTLGVIVNRIITSVKADFLFRALNLDISPNNFNAPIHFGGPVESEKGLILHSNDYQGKPLLNIENSLALSSNVDILKDIAIGNGPKDNFLALGYSGWAPGQLEDEIKRNSWIAIPYSHELVFANNHEHKWNKAISSLGINQANFSSSYGKA